MRSRRTGNGRGPPRLDVDLVAVLELAHVQLAGGRAPLRPVGLAVDHHPAGPADALAAVVLEGDRLATGGVELLVHDVEHLEEAHLLADVRGVVGLHGAGGIGAGLAPDVELHVHVGRTSTCTSAGTGGRSRTRAAPCGAWAGWGCRPTPRPPRGRSARHRVRPRRRGSGDSSRKWPPQDSSRSRASRHHELAELEEVGHAAGPLEGLVHGAVAQDPDVLPELLAAGRGSPRAAFSSPVLLRAMPQ